ncbi:trypsin-like serine protease [Actinotalea ferrariae]|uniref:trypsin-like serine protease n=1 Tax=Actinotalea ferrariae TaxID=1386098 RepID=UPI0005587ED4|nr:trypsin-like serine protease [Actinotalea ferrariae]
MRFTRAAVAFVAALGLAAATAAPAAAIRYGEPDDGEHPYVGIMIAYQDGKPAWRCSGTLVSPTVYLTAGHCTFGADSVRVWFVENARAAGTGYPTTGGTTGTPYDHPDYDDAAFYLNDLGVVVLDEAVVMPEYASVAPLGYFDPLFVRRGPVKQQFTAVGYGLQRSMPEQTGLTEARPVRMQATVSIINQDAMFGEKKAGNSVIFTNNAATGGTCSGDSGGPVFIAGTSVIAAVTSFGVNARCAGTGGGYRVDQADDLAWLAEFGIAPLPAG